MHGGPNRNLGTAAGSHIRCPSNTEHSGSEQVAGPPAENWDLDDDAAGGGENMHDTSTFKDWIRLLPDRNFHPDLVPDAAVVDYLGGTVGLSANKSGSALEAYL